MSRSRPPDAEELPSLRSFWERLDATRERSDQVLHERAIALPAFAALAARMPPEVQRAQRQRTRELQRLALVDGDWKPYLEELRALGRMYGSIGIEFEDWYDILGGLRAVLLDEILPRDAARERSEIAGMSSFLDRAMAAISGSYIEAKQERVRRAESELQLYVDVFLHATFGVAIYRLESPPDPRTFRLVAVNPAAVRSNPLLAESIGYSLLEIAPALAHGPVGERWVSVVETREPYAWTHSAGGRLSDVQTFPLPGRHICLMFHDVTETRRLEESVHRHVVDLERSNRDLDDFAYVTSHDLRAPLQDVRNLAQWIAEDAGPALPTESKRHLGLLQDRIGRMERLLDDLLEYSRVGRGDLPTKEFTFGALVDEVLALAPPPEGSGVTIGGRDVAFTAPHAPLEKVMRNLIANAIKHHDREVVNLSIDARAVADRAEISVTDDGPGIPPEYHERVFRMFQTLRPRDQVEASGVGLAIVKKTIEHQGGRVVIESDGRRGTTMRFDWPRWPSAGGSDGGS